jgi:hypothetical protein
MTPTHELHAWLELAQRRRIVMLRCNKAISAAHLKEILPWKMPAALASPATLVSVYPRSSRRFCRLLPRRSRAHLRRGAAIRSPTNGARKRRRTQRAAAVPLERLIVQKAPELPAPAWMLQLAQRLGLDLADALAGHRELLADFLQRVIGVHADAEAHAQHALLARRQ